MDKGKLPDSNRIKISLEATVGYQVVTLVATQHPFWGDVSLPADAKRRTDWADLLKRAVRRLAVSLGIKAQGMSEVGVVGSIVGMLSFVIIGIVGFGTMM